MSKKIFWRRFCIALVLVICVSLLTPVQSEAAAKNSAANVVKLYRQGKYSKARTMAKKLPKKASKKYEKNMSKKMKKAYLKKVKSFKTLKNWSSSGKVPKNGYIWGYYLVDIDNDKKTDLIVKHGTCEAEVMISVYTYTKGKVKKIGTEPMGHTALYDYPGKKGIIVMWGHMGGEEMSILKIKGKKLVWEYVGGRDVSSKKYIQMPYTLNSHWSSKHVYGANLNALK